MKYCFALLMALVGLTSVYAQPLYHHEEHLFHNHPRELKIIEKKYDFVTVFDVENIHGHEVGSIAKNRFSLWTHYDYTKAGSGETTRGYLRSLSLGQVFTWAGILDVYTSNGSLMGTVQGCWMTLSPSKFEFYSAEGRSLGTAYMDANKMGFTIVSAGDERTVAKFTRMSVPNQTDYWYLNIYEDDIAPELLLTFGAFAVDNQGEFRVDN